MCGIAGMMRAGCSDLLLGEFEEVLGRMATILDHRGPDDAGTLVRGDVGFAFARLSIIDIEGGHQPMESADGRVGIVFNGEIYNHRELRAGLEARGHAFRTRSDTEVLLALYAEYGESLVDHVNGMFAFAIHDRDQARLILGRDRLGKKPLYYHVDPRGRVVFGSELKALLCCPWLESEIDIAAVDEFFRFGFIPAPRSVYRNCRVLPPAHIAIISDGQVDEHRYWSVRRRTMEAMDLPTAKRELLTLLEDAVRLRLVADVPVGAFLSGGIDSGLTVAVMSRAAAGRPRTFTIRFQEEEFDESPWARAVAQRYDTDHTEIMCEVDVRDLLEPIVLGFDQPFADSSAVPTFLVCREASRHVKVVLSGDGGDEGFAGYGRHGAFALRKMTRVSGLRRGMSRLGTACIHPFSRGSNRVRQWGLDENGAQLDTLVIASSAARSVFLGDRMRDAIVAEDRWLSERHLGGAFAKEGGLRRMQHQELDLFLPSDILEKVDRTSMMNSLEVRVPFLDHRIVEFGLNVPASLKNDGSEGKILLRELARDLLPAEHLTKPKTGFAIPRDQWLRHELREMVSDLLGRSLAAEDGWLKQSALDRIVALHRAGRSLGTLLWAIMVFEIWYRARNSP